MNNIDPKNIIVTIDRGQAYRRYQLNIINLDGTTTEVNGPLSSEDFQKAYGFSEVWPHYKCENCSDTGFVSVPSKTKEFIWHKEQCSKCKGNI